MRVISAQVNVPTPSYLPANHLYVDSGVSVAGDGSMLSPFKTISEALAVSGFDSIICVYPGTYTEDIVLTGRQNLVCATQLANQTSYPVVESGHWPIVLQGNITVNFTLTTTIGIADVFAHDVIINCQTPSDNNNLQLHRCWVRDIIANNRVGVSLRGSVPSFSIRVDSVVRSILGGNANVECIFTYWGLASDNTYTIETSSVLSFQMIESTLLGNPQTVVRSAYYSTFTNCIVGTLSGNGILNVEFTTPNMTLQIFGWSTPVTVSGPGAYINESGIPWSNDISDRAFNMVIGTGVPSRLGFFDNYSNPVSKPTVVGSKIGGAALSNLLVSLDSLGLISDSTTSITEGLEVAAVDDFSTLISLQNIVAGQKVRVNSVGRNYEFTRTNTSPTDGIVVIDCPLGQWHSLEGTSDQKWLSQATWYVDSINGNDENSGIDSAHTIKTTDEIQRRWGTNPTLNIRTTINYINMPDVNNLTINRASDSSGINIVGTATNVIAGTIGTYTQKNDALNRGYDVVAPEISDWTAYVGMRVLANGNAVSWVRKADPDGYGINHAGISAFYQYNSGFGSITHPVTGQSLVVQRLSTCSSICITVKNGRLNDAADGYFQPAIYVKDIAVTKQCTFNAPGGICNISLYGCDLVDLNLPAQGAGTYTVACRERFAQVNIPQQYARGVLFDKSTYTFNVQYHVVATDSWTSEWKDCTWSQIGIQLSTTSTLFIQECQAFDWSTSAAGAIELPDGATILLLGNFSGKSSNASTYGIKARPSCSILYNALNGYAAGAGGEILCVGIGSFLWSDKPLYWGQAKGTGTLVNGTATIQYKNIPADAKIFVTYNTLSGVPGNKLSVPQASRTNFGTATSQFIVNSDGSGDTSSFDWMFISQSTGNGGMFAH